ncbi:queuosine biosynthesis protein QueC, partial [mine drainage metagenome]
GSALTDPSIALPQGGNPGIPITYVPARNTIFLALALGWAETLDAKEIFIGVNAVDFSGYPDCRPEFIQSFAKLAACATKAGVEGRPVHIEAPLLNWSKAEIIRKGRELGIDYADTVSCYAANPSGLACGVCDACRIRRKGFQEAGIPDPTRYAA